MVLLPHYTATASLLLFGQRVPKAVGLSDETCYKLESKVDWRPVGCPFSKEDDVVATVLDDFPMPKNTPKQKPIHEVRLGAIKAAVWKNETENGVRFNATLSRLYKDGEQWKSTDSFGRDDLLLLAKVADETHSWICAQAQEQPAAT